MGNAKTRPRVPHMVSTLPKRKKRDGKPAHRRPERTGIPVQVYLDPKLFEQLEAFIDAERAKSKFNSAGPTKTEVCSIAIQEFLHAQGYWPTDTGLGDEE